jgi:ATP-dependent helicase/nuclease subunit B
LRETVERPNAIAALVTPDRALGRRVAAALERWSVVVDDSGGDALAETTAGMFARLVIEVALGGVAPVELLALLKHRLFRLGTGAGAMTRSVTTIERALLRGPRPRAGTKGLRQALGVFRKELAKARRKERSDLHPSDPRLHLSEDDLAAAAGLIEALARDLAPLEKLDHANKFSFRVMAAAHREAIAALSRDQSGDSLGFAGADGNALARVFEDITGQGGDLVVAAADYAELFLTVLADRTVRRTGPAGSRVCIYGPLEARLTSFDRVVLGGLAEGIWPPDTRTDPWLSRPMRRQLGLDLPERRVGLSAHDFAQMLGAPEVILTRAAKLAGAPTVASRFVQRMAAIAGPTRWASVVANGAHYVALARALDKGPRVPAITRPEPRPPRRARPTALSVTDIEHWLRDPYTIYARHVLKLIRLDRVDTPPGAADRGSAIHAAVGEFSEAYARGLSTDPVADLLRIGRTHFAFLDDYPEAVAFWWPRYERIARWLAGWEIERRRQIAAIHAEVRGEIASSAAPTAALPSSISRPATFRASGRCASVSRRSSR